MQTQERALGRQGQKCAICGVSFLDFDIGPVAQHIVPTNTAAKYQLEPEFIRGMDNCAVVCDDCHNDSSRGGQNQNGFTGGSTAYPFFGHDTKMKALAWNLKINRVWNQVRQKARSEPEPAMAP